MSESGEREEEGTESPTASSGSDHRDPSKRKPPEFTDEPGPSHTKPKQAKPTTDDSWWDCTACTFRNTAADSECRMCNLMKGASSGDFDPDTLPSAADRRKSWHKHFPQDLRDQVADKLILHVYWASKLHGYQLNERERVTRAQNIERDVYESADSWEEYGNMLDESIRTKLKMIINCPIDPKYIQLVTDYMERWRDGHLPSGAQRHQASASARRPPEFSNEPGPYEKNWDSITALPLSAAEWRKSWHEDITQEYRDFNVVWFIKYLKRSSHPAEWDLVTRIQNIESYIYESANSMDEYYDLLGDNVSALGKKLWLCGDMNLGVEMGMKFLGPISMLPVPLGTKCSVSSSTDLSSQHVQAGSSTASQGEVKKEDEEGGAEGENKTVKSQPDAKMMEKPEGTIQLHGEMEDHPDTESLFSPHPSGEMEDHPDTESLSSPHPSGEMEDHPDTESLSSPHPSGEMEDHPDTESLSSPHPSGEMEDHPDTESLSSPHPSGEMEDHPDTESLSSPHPSGEMEDHPDTESLSSPHPSGEMEDHPDTESLSSPHPSGEMEDHPDTESLSSPHPSGEMEDHPDTESLSSPHPSGEMEDHPDTESLSSPHPSGEMEDHPDTESLSSPHPSGEMEDHPDTESLSSPHPSGEMEDHPDTESLSSPHPSGEMEDHPDTESLSSPHPSGEMEDHPDAESLSSPHPSGEMEDHPDTESLSSPHPSGEMEDHPVTELLSSPHPSLGLQDEALSTCSSLRMGESSSLPRSRSLPSLSQIPCIENKASLRTKRSHSLNDVILLDTTQKITPDIVGENNESYWFHCTQAGLFQCSVTGLVFKMEAEGEVTYRTVPWNPRLLCKIGKRPAGPLFDIKCPQTTMRQLHFPHCEILSIGGGKSLFVLHVMDDGRIELIDPCEITETHVVINVTGFSEIGIIKSIKALFRRRPIKAMVLLFYTPQIDDKDPISTLNVLVLPENVVLDEVIDKRSVRQKRETFIEKPPCELIPQKQYSLSTSPPDEFIKIEPRTAKFEVNESSYHNYIPTFQVTLNRSMKDVKLLLKDSKTFIHAWESRVNLPAPAIRKHKQQPVQKLKQVQRTPRLTAEHRLLPVRSSFIQSISDANLNSVVDKLLEEQVLTIEEQEEAGGQKTRTDKARFVFDTVMRKGSLASKRMISIVCDIDRCLSEELKWK